MSEAMILSRQEGAVGILTINRPKVLNALSNDVMQELSKALLAFENDDAIKAIVLAGGEKAFAAGADIAAMKDYTYADVHNDDYIGGYWHDMSQKVRKPVLAAVHGYALGGGCEL